MRAGATAGTAGPGSEQVPSWEPPVMKTPRRFEETLARPRYEVIPMRGVERQLEHLPPQAKVTITCSPTKGIEPTLELAEHVAARGLDAVPHLSARLVSDRTRLGRILDRLRSAAIREVFVIGGDAPQPLGTYECATELLAEMNELGHGLESLGVAAYPETHPHIGDGPLVRALESKQQCATYVVTQMCFDPETVTQWLHTARERGVVLPAVIGIAGPVDTKTLLRISMKVGIRDSARFLGKHTRHVGRMLQQYRPEELLRTIEPHLTCDVCRIAGFHIYSFNQVERVEAWRNELLEQLRVSGEGVEPEP